MAGFGIIHRFEGGTSEQYDNTLRVVHPEDGRGLPPGQLYHAAGPIASGAGDGLMVVAIWDAEASWTTFRDESLLPGLTTVENGLPGPPVEITFDVHNAQSG